MAEVLQQMEVQVPQLWHYVRGYTYRYYFTYLTDHQGIQGMIYTTNWIERLQRNFRRVLGMRGALPDEESVTDLMAKTAMEKTSYYRALPRMDWEKDCLGNTFQIG